MNEKKDVYERSNVQEYWIVEPGMKVVKGFFLEGGAFELVHEATGLIESR